MTWADVPQQRSSSAGGGSSGIAQEKAKQPWGGRFHSTTADGLAADTAALYTDAAEWVRAAGEGAELLRALFDSESNLEGVVVAMEGAVTGEGAEGRRRGDFAQAMLWQSRCAAFSTPFPQCPSSEPFLSACVAAQRRRWVPNRNGCH